MGIKKTSVHNQAFTIVEVLIVIIVIGILASITVISYNSIKDNANGEAVSTDLQTTASELTKYKNQNGNFPSSSGVFTSSIKNANTSGDTTYTYFYSAGDNGYCLEAAGHDMTYHITDGSTDTVEGPCDAVEPATTVTNRIKDPNVTVLPTASMTMTGVTGDFALINDSTAHSGTTYTRLTLTSSGGSVMEYILNSTSIDSTLLPNTPYTLSVKLRSSKNITFDAQFSWTDGGGTTTLDAAETLVTPANQWTTLALTGQASAPVTVKARIVTAPGQSWSIGDTFDFDSFMLTQGSTVYQYRDGTSAGWSWTGAANNSASTGPTYPETF